MSHITLTFQRANKNVDLDCVILSGVKILNSHSDGFLSVVPILKTDTQC